MKQTAGVLLAASLAAVAAGPTSRPGGAIRSRFLIVDNGAARLVCVDQREPSKGWSVAIPAGSRDLERLDANTVLVSHGSGAGEYALADGRKLWSASSYRGISSARRLPNGNTLLAGAGKGVTLYEVARDGKEVRRTELPGTSDPRLIRLLGNGHVLVAMAGPHRIVEVDAAGRTVWQAALPGKGYVAERQPDGTTLATVGGECLVLRLGKDGKPVATLGGKDKHPAARLQWFSGMHVLSGGDIVVADWLGHGKAGQGPHVVRFSPDNRIVWQWEDHQAVKTATNVLVLGE